MRRAELGRVESWARAATFALFAVSRRLAGAAFPCQCVVCGRTRPTALVRAWVRSSAGWSCGCVRRSFS